MLFLTTKGNPKFSKAVLTGLKETKGKKKKDGKNYLPLLTHRLGQCNGVPKEGWKSITELASQMTLMLSCHKLVSHNVATQQSWSLSLPALRRGTMVGTQGIYRNTTGLGPTAVWTYQATLWPLTLCLIQQMLKSSLFQTAQVRSDYLSPL